MRAEVVKLRKVADVRNPEIITDTLVSIGIQHYKRLDSGTGFPGEIQQYPRKSERNGRKWPEKPKIAQSLPGGIRPFLKKCALNA